jgi:tetratricopeptide (TPR) repeat protein
VKHDARARGFALSLVLFNFGCPDKPLETARKLEQSGDKLAAAKAYTIALKADRANLSAWDGALRIWCEELARIDKCLEILDLELATLGNLRRHQDHLSVALEKRARTRIKQGLVKSALMDLKRAQKAGPTRASVLVVQAIAYNALGIRHLAVQALQRARKLDPQNKEANEIAKRLPDEEAFGGSESSTQATDVRPSD